MKKWTLFIAWLGLSQFLSALDLQQFRYCIGPGVHPVFGFQYGSVCTLDGGTYDIGSQSGGQTLEVLRSNIIVEGTKVTSISDTTLRRTASAFVVYPIMRLANNVGFVTIRNLFFDGNRAQVISGSTPYKCINAIDGLVDLELGTSHTSTLSSVEFDNSPWISVNGGSNWRFELSKFSRGRISAVINSPQAFYYANWFQQYGTGPVNIGSQSTFQWNNFFDNHSEFS